MNLRSMLFTELVSKYLLTEEDIYEEEMRRRLKFCSFDEESIVDIIRLEMKIIKRRNLYSQNSIMDIFSWTNYINNYKNNIDFKLFNMPLENYAQVDNQEVLDTTLSTAELAILYTDGQYLYKHNKDLEIPTNMVNDIKSIAIDKKGCVSNLKLIYNAKFDLVYMLNNDTLPSREFALLCSRFFRNEVQIVIKNKWMKKFKFDNIYQGCDFEPYSIDYFKNYELK